MYDVKPVVYAALSSIPDVEVSDEFPASAAQTPHITFKEGNNSNYRNMTVEVQSEIIILIDIWHTRSTGTLAKVVNEKMAGLGFSRQLQADLNDPSGIKRKTMRYRGVVDKRTNLVHQ